MVKIQQYAIFILSLLSVNVYAQTQSNIYTDQNLNGKCDSTCITPTMSDFALLPAPADPPPIPIPSKSGCVLPWGGTIDDENIVTAWNVAAGGFGACQSETRQCNNGTLSGSFGFQSCSELFNGACGSANGQTLATAPTATGTNLCATGDATASPVATNATTYTWTCPGDGGGSTASCSANKTPAFPPVATKFEDYAGWCAQGIDYQANVPGNYVCVTSNGVQFYNTSKQPITAYTCSTTYGDGIYNSHPRSAGSGLFPSNPMMECAVDGQAIGQEYYSVAIYNGKMYIITDWYSGYFWPYPKVESIGYVSIYIYNLFKKNW